MSLTTTSDDLLNEALEHVEKARKCLSEAIDPETWGSDSYNTTYLKIIEKSIYKLVKIKRKLD